MAEAVTEHPNTVEVSPEGETGNTASAAGETGSGNGSERKRTRGARAKRTAEAISETPQVEPQTIKPDKRRTRRNPTARKKDREVGSENAAIILSLLDGLAVTVLGPEASLNDFERLMIQEPLERIMSRIHWETGEAVNRWMDPVLLTIGLIGWGGRLLQIAKDKRESTKLDDGLYGPKQNQTQAQPETGAAAAQKPADLGEITSAPVQIGRESERLSVRVEDMR
jgi:hypothetical protein